MRALAAFVLVLATASAAQEPAFGPEATEACLAGAEDTGMRACVGRSADACTETPGGYTTVGMGYCLGREHEYWDARLNAAYGALMELERSLDAEMEGLGSSVPSMAEALRDMQRAWIGYRDAACLYEHRQWGGGTGGGPAHAECMMRLTGERALALEDRLAAKRSQ